MDSAHWDRIVSIAETSPEQATDPVSGPGFTWVDAVVIGDGPGIVLAPPEHLRPLIDA